MAKVVFMNSDPVLTHFLGRLKELEALNLNKIWMNMSGDYHTRAANVLCYDKEDFSKVMKYLGLDKAKQEGWERLLGRQVRMHRYQVTSLETNQPIQSRWFRFAGKQRTDAGRSSRSNALLSSADEGMADNNLPGSETQMNALDNYYIALEARQLLRGRRLPREVKACLRKVQNADAGADNEEEEEELEVEEEEETHTSTQSVSKLVEVSTRFFAEEKRIQQQVVAEYMKRQFESNGDSRLVKLKTTGKNMTLFRLSTPNTTGQSLLWTNWQLSSVATKV
jgi:hypothetical protein